MFPEGRILDFVIVGIVALIVVGPKDLPVLMRKVGRFLAHMRGLAAEFRASFDEMARQSELDELRREVEALRTAQPLQTAAGLGPDSGVQEVFDDIHASLREGQAQLHPVMSYQHPIGVDIREPLPAAGQPQEPESATASSESPPHSAPIAAAAPAVPTAVKGAEG